MQGVGGVGSHVHQAPVPTMWGITLHQWSALLLCMAYLVTTSTSNLTLIASSVIHWAFYRYNPALIAVIMARLARAGHGQAQRL